jgi:hypothetical protein
MTEVEDILARARARERVREENYTPPDYKSVSKVFPKQKAALTRAINSGDRDKIVVACAKAVREWSQPPFNGAWPDDWSRWQRALEDAFPVFQAPRLEDLA